MLLEEKKNKKRTLKIFVDKKVSSCMLYFLKRESNHTLKNSHTCTVVSISAESRISKAAEESLCICTSGTVPASVVGILSKLIYVWDQIDTMIYATMILGRE